MKRSLDAINIRPPIPPFATNTSDWAHIDQTSSDNPFLCVQGQAVLTTTTAGFRCSPKSHLVHSKILARFGKTGQPGEWFKYRPKEIEIVKEMVESAGGKWQIPIIAPKGSLIFWFSATTHSAKLADPIELTDFDPEDKWKYWRGVVYCSQRPKSELSPEHLRNLQYAAQNNITTNHWGSKLFTKLPYGAKKEQYNAKIQRFAKSPKEIFKIPGLRPALSKEQNSLLGL